MTIKELRNALNNLPKEADDALVLIVGKEAGYSNASLGHLGDVIPDFYKPMYTNAEGNCETWGVVQRLYSRDDKEKVCVDSFAFYADGEEL